MKKKSKIAKGLVSLLSLIMAVFGLKLILQAASFREKELDVGEDEDIDFEEVT